jgi:hypothetical protein
LFPDSLSFAPSRICSFYSSNTAPFTARDAIARDIGPVLSLSEPRAPDQWPDVVARLVPKFDVALLPPDLPLSVLGKALLHGMLAFEKTWGASVPTISPEAKLTGAEAINIIRDSSLRLFPGLQTKT